MTEGQTIFSVSGVTAIIKDRLSGLRAFTVEGEVSNCRLNAQSGHLYFTLGDDRAKLNALYLSYARQLQKDFPAFSDGAKVRATGKISVYEPSGTYRLLVSRVELCDGVGDLLRRFEALKQKLFAEGLCDPKRKRPLPTVPRRVGIVTAPGGAAIRDILNVLGRRFPNLHILLSPCRVQGAGAEEEIARAIRLLNTHFGPGSAEPLDAMIVGRGGGSLEDLWCFNEEVVARAVASSAIPVISAVGHEPDIAITDFVADLRAPTPSAAAELLCGRKEDFEATLTKTKDRLLDLMRRAYADARNDLRRHQHSALFRDPALLLATCAQHTDGLGNRLDAALAQDLARRQHQIAQLQLRAERLGQTFFPEHLRRLDDTAAKMNFALARRLDRAAAALAQFNAKLDAYNPYAVLARGYTLVTSENGHVVTDAAKLQTGDTLTLRFAQGSRQAAVLPEPEGGAAPGAPGA